MTANDHLTTLREAVAETDLRGLDYLDERRAARYAGVSVSQFRAHAARHGILCVRFMGRKVYRKSDIQRAIEREWQRLESSTATGNSTGATKRAATA